MKASSVNTFRKTSACPSSNLLLSYRSQALSPEVAALVCSHLASCEFCTSEIKLLAHYPTTVKKAPRAPELPINLRILAESIMSQSKPFRKKRPAGGHGLLLAD